MTIPRLANAELAVMERLWKEGRLTARRLREKLYPDTTGSAHGTIQRLLQRLEDKGFVHRDGSLGTQLFSARVSRKNTRPGGSRRWPTGSRGVRWFP